jgi:hypothetical protein
MGRKLNLSRCFERAYEFPAILVLLPNCCKPSEIRNLRLSSSKSHIEARSYALKNKRRGP